MAKLTVTIPDELASLVLDRQQKLGYSTPEEAAVALISEGLAATSDDEDHSLGHSDDELRALIAEAEESGEPVAYEPGALRVEVLRRFAERTRK